MIPHLAPPNNRKSDLITIGVWALITGRSWLVCEVHAALVREGLTHA